MNHITIGGGRIPLPSMDEAINAASTALEATKSYGKWAVDCVVDPTSYANKAHALCTSISSQAAALGSQSVTYLTELQGYIASYTGISASCLQTVLSGAAVMTPVVGLLLGYRNVCNTRKACDEAISKGKEKLDRMQKLILEALKYSHVDHSDDLSLSSAENGIARCNNNCKEMANARLFTWSNIGRFTLLNAAPALAIPQLGLAAVAGIVSFNLLTKVISHHCSKKYAAQVVSQNTASHYLNQASELRSNTGYGGRFLRRRINEGKTLIDGLALPPGVEDLVQAIKSGKTTKPQLFDMVSPTTKTAEKKVDEATHPLEAGKEATHPQKSETPTSEAKADSNENQQPKENKTHSELKSDSTADIKQTQLREASPEVKETHPKPTTKSDQVPKKSARPGRLQTAPSSRQKSSPVVVAGRSPSPKRETRTGAALKHSARRPQKVTTPKEDRTVSSTPSGTTNARRATRSSTSQSVGTATAKRTTGSSISQPAATATTKRATKSSALRTTSQKTAVETKLADSSKTADIAKGKRPSQPTVTAKAKVITRFGKATTAKSTKQ